MVYGEADVDYQLKGKRAYVSAGAHGIGEAIADLLTQEGAEVIVADADSDVLRQKAGKWRGSIAADLATADGVNTATFEFDKNGSVRPGNISVSISDSTSQAGVAQAMVNAINSLAAAM